MGEAVIQATRMQDMLWQDCCYSSEKTLPEEYRKFADTGDNHREEKAYATPAEPSLRIRAELRWTSRYKRFRAACSAEQL